MDEIYGTYVDNEHVDNHDYDDNTDDDHDNNNDINVRAFHARVNASYTYVYIGVFGFRIFSDFRLFFSPLSCFSGLFKFFLF